MRAETALLNAYAEWRRLIEAANHAASGRNWPLVAECHRVVASLQPQITALTRQALQEWEVDRDGCLPRKEKLRQVVLDLIKLVESHTSVLNSVRERINHEHQEREQAGRNLKLLKKSYVVLQGPAWSSLS